MLPLFEQEIIDAARAKILTILSKEDPNFTDVFSKYTYVCRDWRKLGLFIEEKEVQEAFIKATKYNLEILYTEVLSHASKNNFTYDSFNDEIADVDQLTSIAKDSLVERNLSGIIKLSNPDKKEDPIYIARFTYVGESVDDNIYIEYAFSTDPKLLKQAYERVMLFMKEYSRAKANTHYFKYGDGWKPRHNVLLQDVILHEETKQEICDHITGFFKNAPFYKKHNLPYKRGFLIVGPPGNGKTMLCKALTSTYKDIGVVIFPISNDKGMYGESISEQFLGALNLARSLSPSILLLEDVDALLDTSMNKSQFLNILDGIDEAPTNGVIIIGTTNHPEVLDEALTDRPGRFDKVWHIDLPDLTIRREYLKFFFNDFLEDKAITLLAEQTEGFSMAYLKEVYISSLLKSNGEVKGEELLKIVLAQISMLKKQSKSAKKGHISPSKERKAGFGN